MYLFFPVMCLFLLFFLYKTNKTNSISLMKMSFWLIVSYLFLILVHLFSGIKYNSGNIIDIIPYFSVCLILMIFGEFIGKKYKIRNPFKKILIKDKYIALISIFGALLLIYDMLRMNNIIFGKRIQNFQISIIGVIGNILASFGMIAWLSGLYNFILYRKKIKLLSYFSILSYITYGVLSAGRQSILLLFISSLITILWGKNKRKEIYTIEKLKNKKTFGIVIIISLFIVYFLFLSFARISIKDLDQRKNYMQYLYNAKLSEQTINIINNLGPFSKIYLDALFYYSHELHRLALLFQYYDYPPLFGLSQFGYIERRLQWLIGDQGAKSWKRVEYAIQQKGNFFSHTWGTFITNFIMDYGRFGTLFACLISGLIFGLLFNKLKKQPTEERVIRHCIMLSGIIFSIQFSPFAELTWAFPLLTMFFIKIKTDNNTKSLIKYIMSTNTLLSNNNLQILDHKIQHDIRMPVISIITVVMNSQNGIEKTIKSVINQVYPNIEYIIIDGNSTDKTVDIIKNYENHLAFWVSEPDKGIYDAMNKGIALAKGEYINFMNADDVFADNNVINNIINMSDSRSDIIYGDFITVDEINQLQKFVRAKPLSKIWKGMIFSHQAVFIKREKILEVPFNIKYKITADYDQILSLYERKCTFQYLPITIAKTTISGISYSNTATIYEFIKAVYSRRHNIRCLIPFFLPLLSGMVCNFIGEKRTNQIRKLKWKLITK